MNSMLHLNTRIVSVCLTLLMLTGFTSSAAAAVPKAEDIVYQVTPDGVEYGTWGQTSTKPAPTLIILSGNIDHSMTKKNFLQAGLWLAPKGYLCVSIDLPCHAKQAIKGFGGLKGWANRAATEDDFVAEFNGRMSKVLDYLIAQGQTDPDKIAVTGTSRGGFLAIRYAAFDKRIKCAAGYAPVTDLRQLKEFDVAATVRGVDQMSLEAHVSSLIGTPIFIAIGDRDERVGTDSAISFSRKLSAASMKADVPSEMALHVLSEPGGHRIPAGTDLMAARWIYRILEGSELTTP